MNEINAKGGVNGRMIDIIFNDSKANPRTRSRWPSGTSRRQGEFPDGRGQQRGGARGDRGVQGKPGDLRGDRPRFDGAHNGEVPAVLFGYRTTHLSVRRGRRAVREGQKEWKKYYGHRPRLRVRPPHLEDFWMLLGKKRTDVTLVGQAWPKLFEPDYTPYITATS